MKSSKRQIQARRHRRRGRRCGLRPILMTTAAMVLGVVPLVFAQRRRRRFALCHRLVISTGLAIGTLFTLFVVPGVYMLIGARSLEFRRRRTSARSLHRFAYINIAYFNRVIELISKLISRKTPCDSLCKPC